MKFLKTRRLHSQYSRSSTSSARKKPARPQAVQAPQMAAANTSPDHRSAGADAHPAREPAIPGPLGDQPRRQYLHNLRCTYEKMDLYLIDGDVGIWHLKIEPKEGGAPLAQAEYCRGDISTLQLFRGQLHVQQLVADGVELNIERKADGSMPLLQRLLAGAPPAAPKNPGPTKIDLSAPLRIDAMRLIGMRAHIHDAAVSPPLDAQVQSRRAAVGPGCRFQAGTISHRGLVRSDPGRAAHRRPGHE